MIKDVLAVVGIVFFVLAVIIVIVDRIRMQRLIDSLTKMLDDAIKGEFNETRFDESSESFLESKLSEYLSNSSLSAQKVEEEKDKIKALISDISHQTKTPIANLMLYSDLLAEDDIPENVREKVDSIRSQSEKLKFLIDSLVKMSRLENGIIALNVSQTDLYELISSVCDELSSKAKEKGLKLICEKTDIKVKCDPKWTYEAFLNIIDNAIKYTDKGQIKLSVKNYEMYAKTDIEDTGIGIPEEELTKIFGRFSRGNNVMQKEGVGIGLFLTREIVTGEGGYVTVRSKEGEGSCFSVFLPKA
ncbi:MAG: HAMP domain-containing histidine kinase [Clostridiales bacterium]|nr:HAMP domain-containing histidine kinase [Clostridiales bacterium]